MEGITIQARTGETLINSEFPWHKDELFRASLNNCLTNAHKPTNIAMLIIKKNLLE
jgi:hypothetical protein